MHPALSGKSPADVHLHRPGVVDKGSSFYTQDGVRFRMDIWTPEEWARLPHEARPNAHQATNGCWWIEVRLDD